MAIMLFVIGMIAFYFSYMYKIKLLDTFSLDPLRGLSGQALFWISIFVPLVLFFCFGVFSWVGCRFQLSSDSFMNFIIVSKLPLSILALSLPFGLTVTRMHGTKQTAQQMCQTESQVKKLATEKNIEMLLDTFQSLKVLIDEETNNLLGKFSINNLDDCLSLSHPPSVISKAMTGDKIEQNLYEGSIHVGDVIQVCQLIQAASNCYDAIVRENVKLNEHYSDLLLNEKQWLINSHWISLGKQSQTIFEIVNVCLKINNTAKQIQPSAYSCFTLSDNYSDELSIYKDQFDRWFEDEGRRYFGFVYGPRVSK
ncbi:hypothetical protein C0W96_09530 [Photobacterium kishitanii]|nr:hypothetical protein UB40_07125 [Photobacterium kishitanii]OBU27012.1 hypothetical protein AYY23_09410 [Photobacterium kishitanii]PSV06288.1 hypothetical protein C0W96_09530 [Photobacterium kishitanii]PSV76614.1 hypothetical protein C0W29_06705 [Photobacterium kishitanii]PSW51447.1 hypothetical protein C0W66_01065 [Photobacterium kishitanii]